MQFQPYQIHELLKIIDSNQLAIIGNELGSEFFTDADKILLRSYGINPEGLYKPELSSIQTSFHWGMLAEALGKMEAKKVSYPEIKEYVKEGKYLPVSRQQQATLNAVKIQTFSSLRSLNGKIFEEVNNVLVSKTRLSQQQFLAQELRSGLEQKQSVAAIAHEIARKTGDWGRNFDRIIETASQTAYEVGKASEIQRQNPNEDPLVYKRVFAQACKHCIKLYLKNGIGSEPIIFRLSELIANGSNIGRKVDEWKATLDPVHPHCRCSLQYVPKGYIWNTEKQSFSTPDPEYKKQVAATRPLIRVSIGGVIKYL